MPNPGDVFRDAIVNYINSWREPIEVLKEIHVGYRFIDTPRKLDIVMRNTRNNKFMAVECKVQKVEGSAFEKISYTIDDCIASPIPTIIAFAGPGIRNDMKSKLITSGLGIELDYEADHDNVIRFNDKKSLFKQRCFIELGLNWFSFATGDRVREQMQILEEYQTNIEE